MGCQIDSNLRHPVIILNFGTLFATYISEPLKTTKQ